MDEPKPTVISENDIIGTLMHKEQAQRLEHIIHMDSQRLEDLRRIFGKRFDYGPKLDLDEAKQEFLGIKKEIDTFLDVKFLDMKWAGAPNIRQVNFLDSLFEFNDDNEELRKRYLYSGAMILAGAAIPAFELISRIMFQAGPSSEGIFPNGIAAGAVVALLGAKGLQESFRDHKLRYVHQADYWHAQPQIRITRAYRVPTILKLAHEYAHHIQSSKGIILANPENQPFIEGHAKGVARQVASRYASTESNPALLHCAIEMYDLAELKSAYSWIAEKLSAKTHPSLLETKTSMDQEQQLVLKEFGKPSHHAIGNAFFYSQELAQGNAIYKDVIKGEFQVK